MTSSSATKANVKVNFNNRDYAFEELPRNTQLLLKDLMRLDEQISQLQFQLRHLQAAHHTYSASLRQAMNEQEEGEAHQPQHDIGEGSHEEG